jgi:hypothetical protein
MRTNRIEYPRVGAGLSSVMMKTVIFGTLGAHTDRQDAAGVSGRLVLTCGQEGLS